MDKRLIVAALASSLLMPSCRVLSQRVDFSWFSDTLASPQSDSVVVEAGQGLPLSAMPAPPEPGEEALPMAQVTTEIPAKPAPAPAPAETKPVASAPVVQAPAPAKPLATAPVVQAPVAAGRTHKIAKGDTLAAIARRYNTTVPAICTANGITNPNALKLDTVLTIPSGKDAVAAPAPAKPVVAAPAPTAAGTAKKPVAASTTPKRHFWQFWKKSAPAQQAATYAVQRGDTLNAIAHRHGVSPAALMQANGIGRGQADKLSIGQRLVIPTVKK